MILRKLIQYHFECNGHFDNMSEESFYNKIVDRANKENMTISNYLYSQLGYEDTPDISAEMRYKYRKMFSQGKIDELMEIFGSSDKATLINTLTTENCLGTTLTVPRMNKSEYLDKLCRLLATYFLQNEERYFQAEIGYVNISSYLKQIRLLDSRKKVTESLSSPVMIQLLKRTAPNVDVRNVKAPFISGGVLILPEAISDIDLRNTLNASLLQATMNILDMPVNVHFKLMKICFSYFSLQETNNEAYLTMIDYANALNITVSKLLALCDTKHINIKEQLDKEKCIMYKLGPSQVLVYGEKSQSPEDYMLISVDFFRELYNRDLLKTLVWIKGVPYVHAGMQVSVSSLFGLEDSKIVGVE